jgi:short-subunit dehydrogenase
MDRLRRLAPIALGAAAVAAAALLARRRAHRADLARLRGRIVVITGGSRGLGYGLARMLASGGALVTIAARDAEELRRAQQSLAAEGLRVETVRCDVRDEHDAASLIAHVQEHAGPVDVLINDAGVIEVGSVWDQSLDDFRESVETHVFGPLHTMRAVLPAMRARGEGRIANIASLGGLVAPPHLTPYAAGKFGLVGLSQGFAAEVAHDGISVTTVCPGLMRTGSPDHAWFKGRTKAEYTWFALAASMPLVSTSADAAARRIIHAIARRRPFLTITPLARLAHIANGVMPATTTRLLALGARALPPPRYDDGGKRSGDESHSPLAPSLLTALDRIAKRRYNE